jgi:hypothetical protein
MPYPNFFLGSGKGKTFELFKSGTSYLPGVDQLTTSLTINGTTVTPDFRYKGGDANASDWDQWTYGETLTYAGTPAVSLNQGSPLLSANDDSVLFGGSDRYVSAGTSFGDIGTGDVVFEAVVKLINGSSSQLFCATRTVAIGWDFRNQGNTFRFLMQDAGGNDRPVSATIDDDTWYHVMVFINRDEASTNGAQVYVNGVASGSGKDMSAINGDCSVANSFSIGGSPSGSTDCESNVAYLALWQQASWHQAGAAGPTEWATIAQERFLKLTGFYPQKASGTAIPTVITRASQAYLDKFEEEVIYSAPNLFTDGDMEVNLEVPASVNDGDMEAVSTSAWTPLFGTLTKESGAPGGSGSQVLRVTYASVSNPAARQSALTGSNSYSVIGWARGDGVDAYPYVRIGGVTAWTGTTSNSWQAISGSATAVNTTLELYSSSTTVASYVEFDDIELTDITGSVAAWSTVDGNVSKQSGSADGTGSQILRLSYSSPSYYTYQDVLTVGEKYRVSGYMRGNGIASVRVIDKVSGGSVLCLGNSTIDWQYFDKTFTAVDTGVYFGDSGAGSTRYVEFDNLSVIRKYDDAMNINLLDDGYMESVSNSINYIWSKTGNAFLSKLAVDPFEGSQYMRVAWNGSENGTAYQNILIDGYTYRATGVARGDGSGRYPIVVNGEKEIWNGTDDNVWQHFDVTFVAQGSNQFGLRTPFNVGGWTEWDTVTVQRVPERQLYQVGDHWLRYCHRKDKYHADIYGYLPELQEDNICLQSQDFSTTWSQLDDADLMSDGYSEPAKSLTAQGFTSSANEGNHGVTQQITLTAEPYTLSVWAKSGAKNYLYMCNQTLSDCDGYFNVSGGTVGTVGPDASAYIEPWGNGWFRCGLSFTGTAADHTILMQYAEDDNDTVFSGNGAETDGYLWGAQLESHDYMSSYIPTTSAAVTRSADSLRYKGDDGNISNNGKGTVLCNFLLPNFEQTANSRLYNFSDGGTTTDQIDLQIRSLDRLDATFRTSGGNDGDATVTKEHSDNTIHSARLTWKTDDVNVYLDEANVETDSSVDTPDDLDRMEIGQRLDSTSQPNGIISEITIWKRVKTP